MAALLGALLLAPMVQAEEPVRLEPAAPGLGERALLHLQVAPADSTEFPVGLNAAVRPTADPKVFEFVALRVGSVGVILGTPPDTLRFDIPATIEEARPELLLPLRSVGALGPHWGPTILLALLVLLPVVLLVIWLFRRRKTRVEVPVVPLEPAHVIALRELDRLERDQLVQSRRFEEFYVRGSRILRDYAGRRFELPVLDWTTRETLDALLEHPVAAPHTDAVAPLLRAADEVKFARHQPLTEDGERWLRQARDFVHHTFKVEEPEPEDGTDAGPGGDAGNVTEVPA